MPRDGVLKGNPTKDRRSRRKPVEGTRLVEYRKKKREMGLRLQSRQSSAESRRVKGNRPVPADKSPRSNPNHTMQFIKSCFFPTNQLASTSLEHSFWLLSLTFPFFFWSGQSPRESLSLSSPFPPTRGALNESQSVVCLKRNCKTTNCRKSLLPKIERNTQYHHAS